MVQIKGIGMLIGLMWGLVFTFVSYIFDSLDIITILLVVISGMSLGLLADYLWWKAEEELQ